MQQRIAPERCSRKFSEPYPLEEGNIVARFLQVNLRKDHSRTFRTAAASRESEREGREKRERRWYRGNMLRIINEPTAAAIAYGLDKNGNGEGSVLI